jgi:hypothetical protein
VCLFGVGAFWIGDIYHISPAWVFFAWNSIFAIPMLWKPFRPYFRKPLFLLFFLVWICIHGATVVGMIYWLPAGLWPPIMLVEIAAGFLVAKLFFGSHLSSDDKEHEGGRHKSMEL